MSAIGRGVEGMLARRRSHEESGDRPIGWKAAFGSPANLERFDLAGPVVGFLTEQSILTPPVDLAGWTAPVAEPELAVYLDVDLPSGAGAAQASAAIGAVGPAIELADIDTPLDDLESVLARNIFHKGVVFGEVDPDRRGADLAGLAASISHNGAEVARTGDLTALTGSIGDVISHLGAHLAGHSMAMRAGDVVICGSVVPPISITSGDRIEFHLRPFEPVVIELD